MSYSAPSLVEIAAYETYVPDGFTVALKRTGPRSYDYVDKHNGKELYKGTVTVSADGKTITIVDAAVGTNEKTTSVYDRQ